MAAQDEIEQLMAPQVQDTWDSGTDQMVTPEQVSQREKDAAPSGDEIESKPSYHVPSDLGTGIEFYHTDPVVRITQKINQAQADNAEKQRTMDNLSVPIITKDYQDSVTHAQQIQQQIDDTLQKLSAPPPPKQMPQWGIGDLITQAIGLLASKGNPFAVAGIGQAGLQQVQQRTDLDNQNKAAAWEANRQNLLTQLKEAYGQFSDEQQRGYGFQQAGIHGAQQMEDLQQQGINAQRLALSKAESKQAQDARAVISKKDSSPQARQQAMDDLEAEYYRSGGMMGQLFSPAQRASNLQSNYYQDKVDAQTGLIDKQGRLVDAKVLTEGAKQTHFGWMDKNIQSEMTRRGILNGLTEAQIGKIDEQTRLLDPEFQLKAANIHSLIAKRQAAGQGKSGAQVRDMASLARILLSQMNELAKHTDPFTHQFNDPAMAQRYKALSDQLTTVVGQTGTDTSPGTGMMGITQSMGVPPRPVGATDEELKAALNKALKTKGLTPEQKAYIEQKAKAWGVQ